MVGKEQRLDQFFRCCWGRVQANSEEERKTCGRCSQDEDWDEKKKMRTGRRTFSGKGTNWGDGTFAGRIKYEFRFWETYAGCELDEWKMEKTTNQSSELKCTRRRFCLIKLISYSWVITSTCVSTFTVIGMVTLTVLRTRSGKRTCVERFSNKGEDRGHRCLFWWRCQPWRRQEGQEQSMCRVAHPGCWNDRQTDWLAMEDSRWGCTCCGWWGDNHWSWADGGNWSCQSGHVPDEDTGKVEFDLDDNLVDERQRRKKKDKKTNNTDDENENDIARCDEGRRVKVGGEKNKILRTMREKNKMKGNEERGNRRTKTYEMDYLIANSIPWHILVIRCTFLLSVSVRFSRFSQFWHHTNHRYATVIQDLTTQ